MELYQASKQWASRPDDERFASLREMYDATRAYAAESRERPGEPYGNLRVEADGGEVVVVGARNIPARMTHWAFGQLAARVGAPAGYLRELPPTLACQNINHGLKERAESLGKANLLFHTNGSLMLRAFTSDQYGRIWNHEVADRLMGLPAGWRVPPAMTDGSKPSGIYASDHDMFVFLVNEDRRISDGSKGGLARGVFVANSEVGAAALRVTRFLYRYVCGNHIVWGARAVKEISVRHVGDSVHARMSGLFAATLREYADEGADYQEGRIRAAQLTALGKTKDQVLDAIFGKRILSRRAAEEAYDAVLPEVDGSPNTAWGLVQGLTRASQLTPYADERVAMEAAAPKILAMSAF